MVSLEFGVQSNEIELSQPGLALGKDSLDNASVNASH